jgi:hypothetical protein
MYAARALLWRTFSIVVLATAFLVLVRVVFADQFGSWWSASSLGRLIDSLGVQVANWLFQAGSPAVVFMEAAQSGVDYAKRQLTTGNLVSAVLGAIGVGAFNLIYNWLRNRSIRRMCSAMLYSSGLRIFNNIGVLYRSFSQDGKPYLSTSEPPKSDLSAPNTQEVRASLHRLKNEMDALQDFAIAYDYAIWRGLRFLTASVRIRALAVREALEVTTAEFDRGQQGARINFFNSDLGVKAVTQDGYRSLLLTDALFPVLATAVDLAERLEVGFVRSLLLRWWPARGSSLPPSDKVRSEVAALVKFNHERSNRNRRRALANERVWDTWWIASGSDRPLSDWSPGVREIIAKLT